MAKATRAIGITVALLTTAFGCLAAERTYPCFRAQTSPVLDGEIAGDPAWRSMPVATGFSVLGGDYTVAKQTAVQACWDQDALYIGVTCEEPDIAHMKLQVRDGGPGWLDDGIELFLQPPGGKVYQFITTAGAARTAWEGAADGFGYEAAASKNADGYCLEMRFPFALLEARAQEGDLWRGNFCRNIFTRNSGGDQFTTWAPATRQFLEPESFGTIELLGAPPSEAEALALSDRINAPYRQHLLEGVAQIAAEGEQYVPVLQEATRSRRFRGQAARLRAQWRRLQRALDDADAASTQELREMLRGADAMLEASYQVKWTYMIAELFDD